MIFTSVVNVGRSSVQPQTKVVASVINSNPALAIYLLSPPSLFLKLPLIKQKTKTTCRDYHFMLAKRKSQINLHYENELVMIIANF
jgi:hypothetical protein